MTTKGEASAENPMPCTAIFVTNYSPHYEAGELAKAQSSVTVSSRFVKHPFKNGLDDIFFKRLLQAASGYGFVPRP